MKFFRNLDHDSWFIPEFLKEPKASSRSSAGHQRCHGHHAAPEWPWFLTAATVPAVQPKEGKVDVCRGPVGSPKRRGGTCGRYRYLLSIDRSMVQVKTFLNTSCCTSTWLNPLTQLWWNFKEHILQLKSQIFKKMHVSYHLTVHPSFSASKIGSTLRLLWLPPCAFTLHRSLDCKLYEETAEILRLFRLEEMHLFFVAESEDRSAPSGHH